MKIRILTIIFSLLTLSGYSFQSDNWKENIQKLLSENYSEGEDYAGLTLGITLANGETATFALGYSDMEKKVQMSPKARMPGGSTGKIFYSTVAMQLVEEGIFSLDDKVEKYLGHLPWFSGIQNAGELTIRNVLQHSTGISRYVFNPRFQEDLKKDPNRIWTPEDLLSYVLGDNPLFPAGSSFAYSDTNYILLGMVIEHTTQKSLYKNVEERILRKQGFTDVIPQTQRTITGMASGYSAENDPFFPGKVAENETYKYNWQFEWAGGGYVVNAGDLSKMGKNIYEGVFFGPKVSEEYFKGIDAGRLGGQWGLGVHIRDTPMGKAYGHSGFFPGYITNMMYFPQYKVCVAIQTNTSDPTKLSLYRKVSGMLGQVLEGVMGN